MPTVVRKKPGQSDDKLIADFRKKILFDEVLIEMKDREYYKKPSLKKQERNKLRKANNRRKTYS